MRFISPCFGLATRAFPALRSLCPNRAMSSASSLSEVSISGNGRIHEVRLASVKTRNALSRDMIRELRERLHQANVSSDTRCVILKGLGPAFSSGHNLKELTTEHGQTYQKEIFSEFNMLMHDIVQLRSPVIAGVDGIAAAAGCQLVAICDIVVATEKATFSTPGAAFGLFCSTPGVPLARAVHRKMSAYMLMTGKAISAHEALQAGLVSKLVKDTEALDSEIADIIESIQSKPKAVIELGKRFYYRQLELGLSAALEEGGQVMVDNLQLSDAQEGLAAFKEKREPVWTHTEETVL